MAGNGRGSRTLSLVTRNVDARFYAQQATRYPGPVLVLGSGDGRIAWTLAERAERVVAVDPSAVMVEAGEQQREGAAPEVAGRVSFMQADPRALRLPDRFALVVAPQNALGLMSTTEELEAMLVSVRHHLAPGGAFIFDLLNPAGPRGAARAPEANPLEPLPPPRPSFMPHLRERRRRGDGGNEDKGIRRLRHRAFLPEEVDAALARTGLVALERYGDFQGKPFEREDPLQVAVGAAATEG